MIWNNINLTLVKPDASAEDVERVLDGGSDTIFTDHMLVGNAQAAKNALAASIFFKRVLT